MPCRPSSDAADGAPGPGPFVHKLEVTIGEDEGTYVDNQVS